MPLSAPTQQHPPRPNGFTLLELSIVLAILALAMGGVMVGSNMIRAAKLRSIVSEQEAYTQSFRAFKDRYSFYPGDLPNATGLWGALDSNHSTCTTTPAVYGRTDTCNGNGDGMIGGIGAGSYSTTPSQVYEMFRAWQHLVNAELMVGAFTGIAHDSSGVSAYEDAPLRVAESAAVFGKNAPKSAFRGDTGWNVTSTWGLYNTCNDSTGKGLNGTALVFASLAEDEDFNIGLTDGAQNLLSPQEAENMDAKADDGLPSSGNLQAVGLACSVDCSANAAYDIANEARVCGVMYVNQF